MKGFKDLNAKQRRNIMVYGAIILFVFAAYGLSRPGVLTSAAPPVDANNLLGNADSHALQIASINTQVQDVKSNSGQMKQRIDELSKQIQKQQEEQNGGTPSATPAYGNNTVQAAGVAGSPAYGNGTPNASATTPPPPLVPSVTNGNLTMPPSYDATNYAQGGAAANQGALAGAPEIQTWGDDSQKKSANGANGSGANVPPAMDTGTSNETDNAGSSDADAKKKPPKVFIPAGTMLTGVLITGVDAPTGRDASSHPIPVLIRVKEDAVLPNEYRADYRECFIVASAMGDLSSERSYMRGETLSCVARNGGVIQAPLEMWGTGEDGKAGMRGLLVSKQGSIMAKALLAGFASGIGRAFTPQQTTQITSGGSPYQTIPMGVAGRMAGMSGVSSAADQVANYYLQMADSEFPVIEISAGRPVTFIVEKGAELSKLEDNK